MDKKRDSLIKKSCWKGLLSSPCSFAYRRSHGHLLPTLNNNGQTFDYFQRFAVCVILARLLGIDHNPVSAGVVIALEVIDRRTAIARIEDRGDLYRVGIPARLGCELSECRHVVLESRQILYERIPAIIRPDDAF